MDNVCFLTIMANERRQALLEAVARHRVIAACERRARPGGPPTGLHALFAFGRPRRLPPGEAERVREDGRAAAWWTALTLGPYL